MLEVCISRVEGKGERIKVKGQAIAVVSARTKYLGLVGAVTYKEDMEPKKGL